MRGTVIIGEYGATRVHYPQGIAAAAVGMREMQVDTCQRGFSGWLFWTSNAGDTPIQQGFYSLYEAGGPVNDQLKPTARPDACSHARS